MESIDSETRKLTEVQLQVHRSHRNSLCHAVPLAQVLKLGIIKTLPC